MFGDGLVLNLDTQQGIKTIGEGRILFWLADFLAQVFFFFYSFSSFCGVKEVRNFPWTKDVQSRSEKKKEKKLIQFWRGGSVFKSTCCSWRGPKFCFQHPCQRAHSSQGDPMPPVSAFASNDTYVHIPTCSCVHSYAYTLMCTCPHVDKYTHTYT